MQQVTELRAQGLTYPQIAARLDLSLDHVKRLGNPGRYERDLVASREAKKRRTGTCERCGGPTRYAGKTNSVSPVCADCAPAEYGPKMAAKRRGRGPVAEKALAFLTEPRRFVDLVRHLGVTENQASVLLHRLLRYGLIRRISRGVYVRADA
ncbi:MAG TPA: hypothetical protein VM204_06925 [Gaiellaceae bacterium]|nr:hypothetical protein [Gaiellaceae bacterium]